MDANANRASEGLRTLEEYVRFASENVELNASCKSLRHAIGQTMQFLDRSMLLQSRDTQADIGTASKIDDELNRSSISAVITSAAQRIQQSIRVLEEYGKTISVEVGMRFEQIRYRSYDLLKQIELFAIRSSKLDFLQNSALYVLIDCSYPASIFKTRVGEIIEAGADVIQLREKVKETREIVDYGRIVTELCQGRLCKFILNDRVDIGLACGADGVHLGQDDLSIALARSIVPESFILGKSTHSLAQAIEAQEEGADYIGCGPTFTSATKGFEDYLGTGWLSDVAQQIRIPAFAIGGVNASNVDQVVSVGIHRIAVSNAIWKAEDARSATRELKGKLAH